MTGPIRIGEIELADIAVAVPKTRLTDVQLTEFKDLLLRKRAEIVRDVTSLTDEAIGRGRRDTNSEGTMPIHMAELGSDNWEQEFTLGLIANENVVLREIDKALQRVEDRTYGVCLATHKPITVARLRAKPWAKYCIEYTRLKEQGRAP